MSESGEEDDWEVLLEAKAKTNQQQPPKAA
jgi:hypothetical protein